MYRHFSLKEILQHISIYSNPDDIKTVNIETIRPFIENPTLVKLIDVLTNKKIHKEVKQSILVSLNTSLNFTSIKPFLYDKSSLYYLLRDIPLKPIYSFEQIKSITEYVINKSRNTNVYANYQAEEVKRYFELLNLKYTISNIGFSDINWSSSSANADGILSNKNNEDIIVYLRYGTGTGGAQNDRYRNMFDTAYKNPDKKFLFIVDGPEAILEYNLCKGIFDNGKYDNAIWATIKLLQYIDFSYLKFV